MYWHKYHFQIRGNIVDDKGDAFLPVLLPSLFMSTHVSVLDHNTVKLTINEYIVYSVNVVLSSLHPISTDSSFEFSMPILDINVEVLGML